MEDIDYRNGIVYELLPSYYARTRYHPVTCRLLRDSSDEQVIMKEIINGIAYKYTGVEVDAKNVIIGDEAMRRLNSVTHECDWVTVMWLGPFHGFDESLILIKKRKNEETQTEASKKKKELK